MGEIEDSHNLSKKVGQGSFASVYKSVEIESAKTFAVKCIDKSLLMKNLNDVTNVVEEIKAMRNLDSHYTVKLHQVYESETHICLVLDYMKGGDLLTRIQKFGKFSLENAKKIIKRLLKAVEFIHGKGYVHRDIKLENILLETKEGLDIKLADFGLTTQIEGLLTTRCGSPGYIAP